MKDLSKVIDETVNIILLKAENQHELLIGECQSDVKVTNTQEHILMLLAEEPLTNSDLARLLHISQAAVTKAVKGLIKEGLLKTVKDSNDGRITYFILTDDGKPIAHEHGHHHEETLSVYQQLLSRYDEAEKEVIGKFLEDLRTELGKL